MQNDAQDQGSKAKTRRLRDFFYHLVVYIFVLVFLFLVSSVGAALVVIGLGWGFAVALHGVYAYFG
ncbi:MAG: 2TM domain-containing protein [Anaerolineae bacterium]|nr:2TM domain-containing protein [Anaerolineae bacterium]